LSVFSRFKYQELGERLHFIAKFQEHPCTTFCNAGW